MAMMGVKFNCVSAHRKWMLENPVIVPCQVDGDKVRNAVCLDLCWHHFWRLCWNGSDEWWEHAAVIRKLRNMYVAKVASKADMKKEEIAWRKRCRNGWKL